MKKKQNKNTLKDKLIGKRKGTLNQKQLIIQCIRLFTKGTICLSNISFVLFFHFFTIQILLLFSILATFKNTFLLIFVNEKKVHVNLSLKYFWLVLN